MRSNLKEMKIRWEVKLIRYLVKLKVLEYKSEYKTLKSRDNEGALPATKIMTPEKTGVIKTDRYTADVSSIREYTVSTFVSWYQFRIKVPNIFKDRKFHFHYVKTKSFRCDLRVELSSYNLVFRYGDEPIQVKNRGDRVGSTIIYRPNVKPTTLAMRNLQEPISLPDKKEVTVNFNNARFGMQFEYNESEINKVASILWDKVKEENKSLSQVFNDHLMRFVEIEMKKHENEIQELLCGIPDMSIIEKDGYRITYHLQCRRCGFPILHNYETGIYKCLNSHEGESPFFRDDIIPVENHDQFKKNMESDWLYIDKVNEFITSADSY